jgi:hypothetical protein
MLTKGLNRAGLRGWMPHAMSLGSVLLCLLLWPPTLWLIGDLIERHERPSRRWFG